MGIDGLFQVIKERCPNQFHSYSLSEWRGHSFAVDISIFLNKFIKSAGTGLWMNSFFNFLCILKKHGIKAVCVFDGPNVPPEKHKTQASRVEQSRKAKERLRRSKEIRSDLMKYYMSKDISLPIELQEECKKLVDPKGNNSYGMGVSWFEASEVYEAITGLVTRLEKSTAPVTDVERAKAWEIVKIMGVPAFQSDGEAEALCSYLAIHGYVDAVLTEDSDVLAYGTPWMITFKGYKMYDENVTCIYLPHVLKELDYTMEEFRDLCILLSCDYNSRVKGFPPDGRERKEPVGIGEKSAVLMIDEYRRLEVVADYVEDMSPLLYERCREIFSTMPLEEMERLIEVKPYNGRPDMEKIKEFIYEERLSISLEYISKCWEPPTFNFVEDES